MNSLKRVFSPDSSLIRRTASKRAGPSKHLVIRWDTRERTGSSFLCLRLRAAQKSRPALQQTTHSFRHHFAHGGGVTRPIGFSVKSVTRVKEEEKIKNKKINQTKIQTPPIIQGVTLHGYTPVTDTAYTVWYIKP